MKSSLLLRTDKCGWLGEMSLSREVLAYPAHARDARGIDLLVLDQAAFL